MAAWAIFYLSGNAFLSALFGVLFLAGVIRSAGRAFFPHAPYAFAMWIGAFVVFCLLAFFGALFHLVGNLGLGSFVALGALLSIALPCVRLQDHPPLVLPFDSPEISRKKRTASNIFFAFCLASYAAAIAIAAGARTVEATASPWLHMPHAFWIAVIAFFFSCIGLYAVTSFSGWRTIAIKGLLPGALALSLFVSLSVLLYPLGFGFDPFVHQATERVIAETGSITPKPLYYTGQYAVVVALHYLTNLPIEAIDRLLLPVLATAYLFPAIALALATFFARAPFALVRSSAIGTALLASLFIAAWPLSYFIMTTPHGLSSLLALIGIFAIFGFGLRSIHAAAGIGLSALAALAIHPLPGIAFAAFAAAAILFERAQTSRARAAIFFGVGLVISAAYPLAFIAQSFLSGNRVSFVPLGDAFASIAHAIQMPVVPFSFSVTHDFSYLYGFNGIWIFAALAIIGGVSLARVRRFPIILLVGAFSAALGYVLLHFIRFDFLISYQQMDFHARVGELAVYFLFPMCAIGAGVLAAKLAQLPRANTVLITVIAAAAFSANLFMTYPRSDHFSAGRGYTLSAADREAVAAIDRDARETPYAVLSSQVVAAAALARFGFEPYYDTPLYGPLYRYPIPAIHPLHQRYLEMVTTHPSRSLAVQAMDDIGVDRVYFVINHYWNNARSLAESARAEADREIVISDGKVKIYRFDRNISEGEPLKITR